LQTKGRRIKIATHNVYWFQGHPFSRDQPGEENRVVFARLCALYAQKEFDLLCLQEIQSREVADRFLQAMGMRGLYAPGNLYPHYGSLIAVRPGFTLEDRTIEAPSLRERSRMVATVSGPGITLRIANLHLTSGRQSGPAQAGTARARELEEFLSLHGETTDLLVGDLNEDRGRGNVSPLLEAEGLVDAAVATGNDGISASVKSASRTDMIWLRQRWQKHLTGYGVIQEEVAVDDLPGKTFLSDHRPVWVTLEL